MKSLLHKLLARKSSPKSRPEPRRVPLQVEGLEERRVMTVSFQGGSVLQNVEATPVFYGSGWHANGQTEADAGRLTAALQDLVNSPYMDMLGGAYGSRTVDSNGQVVQPGADGGTVTPPIGRGSVPTATFASDNLSEPDTLDATQTLTDSSIQTTLQWWINNDSQFYGLQPDGNRLYVIFVEPNVEVSSPVGNPAATWTSGTEAGVKHFLAYHGSFAGQDGGGNPVNVRYAVVPYLDGATNGKPSWLSTQDTMTEATSHELAEAVTDPDNSGWYDKSAGAINEIGDIANQEVVYQHGFAVQREADPNDQPLTPSDAMPQRQVTFVVQATNRVVGIKLHGGYLWATTNQLMERTPDGVLSPVKDGNGSPVTGVRSISDQGIDNHGKAMIDVVTNGGYASEYHDDGTWTYMDSNVKDAKAGQGVSYVLYNDGSLREWVDLTGGLTDISRNVTAIDAGTDYAGANMVVVESYHTTPLGYFYSASEVSDSSGWHFITSGIVRASAGRNGNVGFVDSTGNAYIWNEVDQPAPQNLGSGATKITVGYSGVDGSSVIDILFSNGIVMDDRYGNWQELDYNVHDLSKARAGVVDTISNAGNAWEFNYAGDYFLVYAATRATTVSTYAAAVA